MTFQLSFRRCLEAGLVCAAALGAQQAQAAVTWNVSSGCALNAAGSTVGAVANVGNSFKCGNAADTNKVVMSAFGANSASSSLYTNAAMRLYSGGWGIQSLVDSTASPDHSMDNTPLAAPDMFLLKFDTAVILQSVSLGWWSSDADITVMAYDKKSTAGAALAPTIAGRSTCSLTDNTTACSTAAPAASTGWTYVQSLGDNDATGNTQAAASSTSPLTYSFNTAGVASSYWLISAYNANYGGGVLSDSSTYGSYLADNVKLLKFSTSTPTTTTKVPEPGSLALASLALLGGWRVRRQRQLAR